MLRMINESAEAARAGKRVKSEAGESFEASVRVAADRAKVEEAERFQKEREEQAREAAASRQREQEEAAAAKKAAAAKAPETTYQQQKPRTRQDEMKMIQDAADAAAANTWTAWFEKPLALVAAPISMWSLPACCAPRAGKRTRSAAGLE